MINSIFDGAQQTKITQMRILHITTHLDIGGIPTYIYNLTRHLIKCNIEVAVASSGGVWEDEFKKLGVKVYRINVRTKNEFAPKLIHSAYTLYQIRKEFKFDIIHSHTRVTQVLAQLFSFFSRVPHIANFHGFYLKNKKRLMRKIIKAQGKVSIAITPFVADDLINIFGGKKERVRTILSGIDFDRLDNDKATLKLNGSPIIGASGRLSSVKGFKYLVSAMVDVRSRYPNASLYIMGDGKERQNLLDLANKAGVGKCFNILTNVSLSAFLKAIDIFCLPSLEEPLGLSVLEAQYFGVPCIASSVDGLKILINHSDTGLLVPPRNSKKISEAIDLLMKDGELRQRISDTCQKEVRDKFDLNTRIADFASIYKEVLDENTGI
ncbi:MAG: glycosyltransferase family 4 protein [Candidatus Omnitrophica bacterium]|nr:glycosyltransferase family 4 protein [Candidatus Omnitrophota bacterium]